MSSELENMQFDQPKNQSNVIKVIGVGGGGGDAVNHMFSHGNKGVDFVICNTEVQALENSPVPNKIQLGMTLTKGLGSSSNPAIGEQSAVESIEEIKNMLDTNTKLVFIVAGMGGGTGTGAAPIIAKMARELGVLTVGVVTIPFRFEGETRNDQAQIGIEKLQSNCDSLIVINNNKLHEVYGNLGFKAGFSKANEVLATAVHGISDLIRHHYTQNIDLRDAKNVLANSGTAMMGSATATGPNRAMEAIEKALDSPLLNDNTINGAKNVLLLIVQGTEDITIDEIGEISDHIQTEAGHSANIIMGVGEDYDLKEAISVTVIAAGFSKKRQLQIRGVLTKTVRHRLFEEDALPESELPFDGYLETSDYIKEIEVEYILIDIHFLSEFEQDSIDEIDVDDFKIIEGEKDNPVTPSQKEKIKKNKDENELHQKKLGKEKGKAPKQHIENAKTAALTNDEQRLLELLLENKTINKFYRKEVALSGFMVIFIAVYIFALNNWGNFVSFSTIIVVLLLVSLKLYHVFSQRSKQYEYLIRKIIHQQVSGTKLENEQTIHDPLKTGVEQSLYDDTTEDKISVEEQMLMFDLPVNSTKNKDEPESSILNVEDIETIDPIEIVPVTEVTYEGVKRYSLDDYLEMEDEEIIFKTKIVGTPKELEENLNEDEDPLNSPVSQLLKDRTDERKKKMKGLNYKFKFSTGKNEDIENEPAYKRMGIELDDVLDENESSRDSLLEENRDENNTKDQ